MIIFSDGFGNVTAKQEKEYLNRKKKLKDLFKKLNSSLWDSIKTYTDAEMEATNIFMMYEDFRITLSIIILMTLILFFVIISLNWDYIKSSKQLSLPLHPRNVKKRNFK